MEVFICKGGSTLLDQFVEHVHFFHQKTFLWIRFSKIVSNSSLKNCFKFKSQKLCHIRISKIVSNSVSKNCFTFKSQISVKFDFQNSCQNFLVEIGCINKISRNREFRQKQKWNVEEEISFKGFNLGTCKIKKCYYALYGLKAPQVLRKYVENIHLWVRQAFLRNA